MSPMHLNEHDANQGAQSKGEFLGMSGNSGWYLLGSAGASILIVIFFWGVLGVSLLVCLLTGLVLCALSVAYVFALKNNKPEHYDTDFFESALVEAGMLELAFGPRGRRPANPFAPGGPELHDAQPAECAQKSAAGRTVRPSAHATRHPAARQPVNTAFAEPRRQTAPAREQAVVPRAAFESLRDELEATEELLEDALYERGEV